MPVSNAELLVMMRNRKAATAALLGLDLLAVDGEAGTIRYAMVARPEFCNPMGNLQGGIIATALDDAAATAVIVKAGRRVAVPTLEFKVSFFAPAPMHAELFASGRVVKFGRTIIFAEADLHDAKDKLLARLSTSVMLLELDGPGHFHSAEGKPL
jgi:uncharacterized protein (TIGR00369 family)